MVAASARRWMALGVGVKALRAVRCWSVSTARYRPVVAKDSWRMRLWTTRLSVPARRRLVAKKCLS